MKFWYTNACCVGILPDGTKMRFVSDAEYAEYLEHIKTPSPDDPTDE